MATSTSGLVEQYLSEATRIEKLRREKKRLRNVEAFPFWPHEAVRSTIIVLAFSAATLYLSALMPYFLEAPANPAGQPEVILPDWYLLWSYGLLKPGVANAFNLGGSPIELPILGPITAKTMGILLNMVIMLPLMAAPFISTGHPHRPQEAPWTAAFGVAGIVYVFNISLYGVNNVVYTEVPWWGFSLARLPFEITEPAMMAMLVAIAFWVLPLPVASFVIRWKLLKESPRFAAMVSVLSLAILGTIIAYGANLDILKLIEDPAAFLFKSLRSTSLLSWVTWWSTLLAFEITYWSLKAWKLQSLKKDTYEHGLNLTYFRTR